MKLRAYINGDILTIQRTKKFFERYAWRYPVDGVPEIKNYVETLSQEVLRLNKDYKSIVSILRSHSSEINEVYQMCLSLQYIKKLNEKGKMKLSQTTEQIVINRATVVYKKILADIQQYQLSNFQMQI